MATMISSGVDVITFLEEQHRQIKALFKQVLETHGNTRLQAFQGLRRLLAVHETAEEEIIHPAVRKSVPDADRIVDARLREENAAKKTLARLEALDVDSPEFDTIFRTFQQAVIEHAESEETQELGLLARSLDYGRLQRMEKAVKFAEKVAPTHPHPGIESASANLLIGPFASMIDRARDAFSSKH